MFGMIKDFLPLLLNTSAVYFVYFDLITGDLWDWF
jgi:hypothetical protein